MTPWQQVTQIFTWMTWVYGPRLTSLNTLINNTQAW